MDKAKRTVRQDIGAQWPDLARELGFSQSDIDEIREREHNSVHSQIFCMFQQWERRSDTGKRSVYELLFGLRKAVSNTKSEQLQGIRDKVFTDTVLMCFTDKACLAWPQLAKMIGLSGDDKRQCSLADPQNLKSQGLKFLSIWCTKIGWKILEELPLVLEEASMPEAANKAAKEIFGKSLDELKQELARNLAMTDHVHFEVGDAVKVNYLGVNMYGTLKWQGDLPDGEDMVGIEMESPSELLGNGTRGGKDYFPCENGFGAFIHITSLQKDDRFSDTSQTSSLGISSASLLIQHLEDGPPKLLIPESQHSPQPTSAPMRRVSESATTDCSTLAAKLQPIQETLSSSHANTSMPHSVVADAPYHQTHSIPAPSATQQSPGSAAVGGPLGYSPPLQPSHEGKVDYCFDVSDESASEEDREFQPLLVVEDQQVYCLRFAGDLGGLIVGRGGSNVRMVEEESHAKVHVMGRRPVMEDVKVLVVGTKENCMRAIELITEQLKHKTANLQKYMESINLSDAEAGKVVGQNGTTKKMIELYSGAALQVERRPEGIEGMFGFGMRKCKIFGSRGQVEKAKSLILDIQQGHDISSLQLAFAFSQMLRSMPQGMSVLNRLDDTSEQDEMLSFLELVDSQPAGGGLGPHEEPETATVKGFTEEDCSTLYHRAIKDNPTITLHVAKAMTIGPPQVGKTALRHHLLELPPPEVSGSTPVMKTSETVSVCSSDSAASPGEVGDVPPSSANLSIENSLDSEDASSSDDSDESVGQKVVEKSRYDNHMCLVTKKKWVLVKNDSGILSLLTYLRDTIAAQSSTAQKPVDSETAVEGNILPCTHETAAEDNILPSTHETAAKDNILQSAHEGMHNGANNQPLDDKSHSIALMSSRIYGELQNPGIADIALPDAHLLQFLDCGGQLAYHDILPLFVNIPAIYLNVFNVAEELSECPIDEVCSTEGNKMYSAKSALSVAEMITRSVMTVCSLSNRKIQLLPDVPCESKPRLLLVGTHLDKLVEKDADEKLKAANEILQKALRSKSRLLERVVVPNEKSQLMFFPVNNKLYVDKSHQLRKHCKCMHCHVTKNLKGRFTKQAMDDAVKVKVPVKWYLHQLLELSQSEKPLYLYSELFQHCKDEGSVTDLGEFHAMVTYFHALGLLIYFCGPDVGHTEESACQVFTNPSYLFENISRLYRVQFEDVKGGDKILLKREGKLTRDALRDLGIQLNPDLFMDLLVQLFIGAEMKSHEGDRILFVPSVLTNLSDYAAPLGVSTGPQENAVSFAVTFESKSFTPCGVFTGMSARLQRAKGWEICADSISRKCMVFAVGPVGTVTLLDHATHISVSMDHHEGQNQEEYRDTVIEAAADSYCFLFHSKSSKDPQSRPCSECTTSPYLVLGQTCQECHTSCDTPEAPHFAELKVQNHFAVSVRCQIKQTAKRLSKMECDLFQNMSHYAVIETQHTGYTLEGEGSRIISPSQTGSKTSSSPLPPISTQQTIFDSKKMQATSTRPLFSVSEFLKKHEAEFFEVINPRLSLLRLVRKSVITEDVKSSIDNSNTEDAREVLYHHLTHHASVVTLREYWEVATAAEGYPNMQSLGRKMMEELEQGGGQTTDDDHSNT